MRFAGKNIGFKKQLIIKVLTIIILISIIVNQLLWLHNMYELYEREYELEVNRIARQSVDMELKQRSESIEDNILIIYTSNIIAPNDTSRYFLKKVTIGDSTYTLSIDKNDPFLMEKITQFALKRDYPIDLNRLGAIFKERIQDRYEVEGVYFDYLDFDSDTLISTTRPNNLNLAHFVLSDTLSLDIIDSIGIVGYVENSRVGILSTMKQQLSVSFLLIVIALISLYYISKSFIVQWKTERMRQESVNVMTHEFKRPISSVVAMTSLIPFYLEKGEQDKALEYVSNIEMDLKRLTHYTKRIQQISNDEAPNGVLNRTDVEIAPFFESLQRRYSVSGNEHKQVEVNVVLATQQRTMYVDHVHFSNVMDNLLENSIKYTIAPIVRINIDVTDAGEWLQVSVKDNGIGISSSDKKHIFDKFYRVKRAETKDRLGFGLGLTYVRSIIDAHGGTIRVNSELNKGSEFVINLLS